MTRVRSAAQAVGILALSVVTLGAGVITPASANRVESPQKSVHRLAVSGTACQHLGGGAVIAQATSTSVVRDVARGYYRQSVKVQVGRKLPGDRWRKVKSQTHHSRGFRKTLLPSTARATVRPRVDDVVAQDGVLRVKTVVKLRKVGKSGTRVVWKRVTHGSAFTC
jgi:hypothetical protein